VTTFVFRLQAPRPTFALDMTDEERAIMRRHAAHWQPLIDAGHMVVVYTAGRMKRNRIKTLAGDRVTVEISPYDLEKGRMIFRHKDERAGSGGRPVQRNHFRRR